MIKIAVITDDRYVNPTKRDVYIDNVLQEDGLLMEALEREGVSVSKVSWSDTSVDWSSFDQAIIRTTWDYSDRLPAYRSWLDETSKLTELVNPYELILWNLDKHYLADLAKAGVGIIPTHYCSLGTEESLAEIMQANNWKDVVIKPAISCAARNTFSIKNEELSEMEATFKQLASEEEMMVQPFQYNVVERGEISLMFVGETITHAVLKKAKAGDYRVQDDFGGTVHDYTPTEEEEILAIDAIKACPTTPVYGRVDIINSNEGKPVVSELEVIEPEIWLRKNKEMAGLMAQRIVGHLE